MHPEIIKFLIDQIVKKIIKIKFWKNNSLKELKIFLYKNSKTIIKFIIKIDPVGLIAKAKEVHKRNI